MYIDPKQLLHTKMIVPRADVNAVQKALFSCGYGYEQALTKVFDLRKYKDTVAFYIDRAGFIETVEREGIDDMDFYTEFRGEDEDEIDWKALF